MSNADVEEFGGVTAKDNENDNVNLSSDDDSAVEGEKHTTADDPTVIIGESDNEEEIGKDEGDPDDLPEESEETGGGGGGTGTGTEHETEDIETQLLGGDDEDEEGEVGNDELGLLGNLEDETEEDQDGLGGNPLGNPLGNENDQEDGEIVEDEPETQFVSEENADKTENIFLDDQEQEQEQNISAMEVDLDAETSQEADESHISQNPLGTTVTETDDIDDADAVTIISDGVDGTNTVAVQETDKISGDISEVNPADFLVPKDGDKIGGSGDAGEDKNDDKEEGEIIDDTDNDGGESVDPDKKKDSTTTDEKKKDKGGGDSQSDDGIIEIDKEGEADEKKESDDEEGTMPMIRMNSSIFEAQDDDDDEGDNSMNESSMDPDMIQNMMEFEMDEGEGEGDGSNILQGILKKKKPTSTEEPQRRVLPRRAAAQAAANTIKEITNLERNDRADNDPDYLVNSNNPGSHGTILSVASSTGDGDRHRCHHCKNMATSLIVVRQYGTDIHLCSNSCFNSFRNPDPTKRPLPCAKCGILNRDTENATVMYWETMNFCSDLCVGNFQLDIGSKCSTCVKRVAWQSLGKYCVRFGSDIRQFCSALCLESYKKNARVCFHCQLDIKRLGNVVMANIPMKATPKEFCGQDCVEMYIEQNLQQPSRMKAIPNVTCCICSAFKPLSKELVMSPSVYQICGEKCWQQLLESQSIRKATKCETCPKFINMEYIKPAFYVATEKKAYGFCSATCKNVFVLKHRQILSCTNCKVKKYNYDLIQSVTGPVVNFAVCSLNCLPKPSQYITNLKETLNPHLVASDRSSDGTPIINSVTSMSTNQNGSGEDLPIQISSVSSLADVSSIGLERSDLTNGGGSFRFSDSSAGSLTLRQANEDDIIEIRDDDIISSRGPHENGIGDDDILEEEVGDVAINDERWTRSDISITFGKPPTKGMNKGTSARPLLITKEVQSDSDELWAMPRVDMTTPTVEKIIYVPVPIPYPVFLPCPFSFFDKPVPMPWPVGVPIPIPIPVDTKLLGKSDTQEQEGVKRIPTPEPEPLGVDAEPEVMAETLATDEVESMDVDEKNDDEGDES